MARGTAFLQDHVSSFVIQCSFCDEHIRKDVPASTTRHPDGNVLEVKNSLDMQASAAGWKSGRTTHDTQLNFCPKHADVIGKIREQSE